MWSAATCRRFELGDMSPSPQAQSCLRTPHDCHQRRCKFRTPEGSIKAKTPVIVLHQGISRQTVKFLIPSPPARTSERGSMNRSPVTSPAEVMLDTRTRLAHRILLRVTDPRSATARHQGSIKAKNPVIVPNQASSRQTAFFPWAQPPHHLPARLFLRHWMLVVRRWVLDVSALGSQFPSLPLENSVFFPVQVWSSVVT